MQNGFIVAYLAFSILTDLIITPALGYLFNNYFLGPKIFTLTEFSILSYFLYSVYLNKSFSKLYFALIFIFIGSIIAENLLSEFNSFDSVSTGVSSLILLFLCILTLYHRNFNTSQKIKFDSAFLFVSAFIIYFSGTFFLYILSKNYFVFDSFKTIYNNINSTILLLRNSIIVVATIYPIRDIKSKIFSI